MSKRKNEERPLFQSGEVAILDCTAGNYDNNEGEPAAIITLARKDGSVEPLVINLRDTRMLALRLLVSLYTNDDGFAEKLLHENFVIRNKAFEWPSPPTL